MKLRQKLSLSLTLTPQMKQSLHILQLPLLELAGFVQAELEENPTLERDDSKEDAALHDKMERLIERDDDIAGDFSDSTIKDLQKKRDYRESLITQEPTLGEHLLQQLRIQGLDERLFKIGEFLIGSLDDNGYLNSSLEEITNLLNSKVFKTDPVIKKDAEKILEVIHTFDPAGVGARNLKECLLIQLTLKRRKTSLAYKIVKNYLADLLNRKYKHIGKKLKVPFTEIEEAVAEIGRLEPKPGRSYEQTQSGEIVRVIPDVVLEKVNDKYEIIINTKWVPRLRLSPYHLELLRCKSTPAHTKQYIRKKIRAALGLIQAITQREQTIRDITKEILKIQKRFFEQGDSSHLEPLILKDIAKKIKRNESTVSRVVSKKYIQTPYGVYRLDYFFSGSLLTEDGQAVSQEHIKSKLLTLIDEEDPKKPLRDSAIVRLLQKDGLKIARRTIAKYRDELKIPPYHQRTRR